MKEKQTLFVVVSLDIYEFESNQFVLGVYSTKELAAQRMKEAAHSFQQANEEELKDGWVVCESDTSFEAYEDGRGSENGYYVKIQEVELDH